MSTSRPAPSSKSGQRPGGNKGGSAKGAGAGRGGGGSRPARRKQGVPRVLWGVVALVVVAVIVIVVVAVTGGSSSPGSSGSSPTAMDAGVVQTVTGVPQSVLTSYGIGTTSGPAAVTNLPRPTAGVGGSTTNPPLLTSGGKPEVFYAGAEYCPYCAADRWALVNALARFGTFSGLKQTKSASNDVDPNTPTFSFVGSSYSSNYLVFVPVELQDRLHNTLETPTKAQNELINKYDYPPYITGSGGSIPFIDIGNQFIQSGANYDPGILAGKPYTAIATAMYTPGNTIGQAIDSTANVLTAAICQITHNQPSSVCKQPYIPKALAAIQSSAKSSSSSGNSTPGGA